jgi:hypothetical protein
LVTFVIKPVQRQLWRIESADADDKRGAILYQRNSVWLGRIDVQARGLETGRDAAPVSKIGAANEPGINNVQDAILGKTEKNSAKWARRRRNQAPSGPHVYTRSAPQSVILSRALALATAVLVNKVMM